MTNMAQTRELVEQFLTEIPQDVRSSALLISLLEKIGFTDTKTLSKLSRVSERMVRHARQQIATPAAMDCQSSGNGLPKAETHCRERQPIAATATDCRPHVRGRAHFELPSEVVSYEGKAESSTITVVPRPARIVDDSHGIYQKLCLAAGNALYPLALGLHAVSEPLGWMRDGADLDLDIIPTVREIAGRAKPQSVRSWGYFAGPVSTAVERRTRGLPPPQAVAEHRSTHKPDFSRTRAAAARLREKYATAETVQ